MKDKLVEKIVRVIKRETTFTEGKYSPLAGPITSDVRKMDCDPTYLAKQIKRAILSDPSICKIEVDAELPPRGINVCANCWITTQKDMANWVKEK